jgi:hypothetical protein
VSGSHCCEILAKGSDRTANASPASPSFVKRIFDVAAWIIPGGILTLLPKCPVCFAAYIAVGTGIGLSVPAATYLRTSLIILCVWSLSYVALKCLIRISNQ